MKHCFKESQVFINVKAEPLESAAAFAYLVRTFAYKNSDWATLYQNLWNTRQRWGMVGKVVTKIGEILTLQGISCKKIMQSGFLYGSESWAVMGEMLKLLEGFNHQ